MRAIVFVASTAVLVAASGCPGDVASPAPAAPQLPVSAPEPAVPPTGAPPEPPAGDVQRSLRVLELALAETADYHQRLVATDALRYLASSDRVIALLEARLGDPEEDVRAAAVLSLGRHRTHSRACRLVRSVRDDAEELLGVRVVATRVVLQHCHLLERVPH